MMNNLPDIQMNCMDLGLTVDSGVIVNGSTFFEQYVLMGYMHAVP